MRIIIEASAKELAELEFQTRLKETVPNPFIVMVNTVTQEEDSKCEK